MHEKTIETKTVFQGRMLTVQVLTVELETGVQATRDIVRHRGAVAVLARLPDGRFVLVRQFRKPVEREVLEVVAGCLESGESPERCAQREIQEEIGYAAKALHSLGHLYPTPGYCDEILHLFFAELGPERVIQTPDDDERLTAVYHTEQELAGMIARYEIADAKTLVAWYRYVQSPWSEFPSKKR